MLSTIFEEDELKKNPHTKILFNFVKVMTTRIQSNSVKLQDLTEKYNNNNKIVKITTENLRKIEKELAKKEYLNSN